mmetsp:Transcript_64431/g.153726  ORF Transcript_64431/g.153726 Transcript_64431/m.153726 type:complete len:209 (+) Transcript_64431:478-1104(+)
MISTYPGTGRPRGFRSSATAPSPSCSSSAGAGAAAVASSVVPLLPSRQKLSTGTPVRSRRNLRCWADFPQSQRVISPGTLTRSTTTSSSFAASATLRRLFPAMVTACTSLEAPSLMETLTLNLSCTCFRFLPFFPMIWPRQAVGTSRLCSKESPALLTCCKIAGSGSTPLSTSCASSKSSSSRASLSCFLRAACVRLDSAHFQTNSDM